MLAELLELLGLLEIFEEGVLGGSSAMSCAVLENDRDGMH